MRAGDVRILSENKGKKIDIISSTMFKSFKIADGLPDNVVTQVIQMSDGKMAIGTNLGITLFNPSHDFAKLTDIVIYNSNTGYPVKSVNIGQNSMFLDSKGIIWAGTGSEKTALVRFDPVTLKKNMEAPTLVIQSIKINGENIPWYDLNEKPVAIDSMTTPAYVTEEVGLFGRELTESERDILQKRFERIQFDGIRPFYPVPEKLILPHELNHISFEFAAIETSRPFMVKYQYMLEGYDKDWSPLTSRSNASFGNISEGTYTFKLKAQGANGVWTDPVSYTFKVLPPWWRSWWAYGSYAVLLGLLVFAFDRVQRRRLIQKERERAEGQRKELELQKAAELKVAYDELAHAHANLKSTQAQLIQSEKMASLGQLTAGIAHEIQNPLNFVNNFSEVSAELVEEIEEERAKSQEARDETLVSEILGDIKENLGKINHHGKRADSIVKGMLEHSRASSGEKVLTDINALADEYLRLSYHGMRAKDKNFQVDFTTHFDPDLPKVNLIPQDIGRVLLNIINNAFQACSSKFIIQDSSFEIQNKPQVIVSTKNLGDKIQISVQDNGPGIPDSLKNKIFQPFFTTKPTGQGTGLGLSLSYDIVKAHGGKINMETMEGEGAEFIITLPVSFLPETKPDSK
ncbi:ATP-binding protein, partial [Aquiflexum sp.]|uniref:ATP-binding protein n=1 Tax=Aquiflexum sp. TaxID=1872584 RepID=UPI003593D382